MIDKALLNKTVEEAIAGTDMFVVDIRVTPSNEIVVELDSPTGMDIDACAAITRKIEEVFDREVEDYELEVGSAGLTAPFKVRGQYLKNIGNEIEVLTRDGRKLRGVLKSVADDSDDFTLTVTRKERPEGAKRPVMVESDITLSPADCKDVRYVFKF
ncbi:MAG: ribosome assembly cofactor RimP [Muribaculaceae bacterium]|nr:ribosome assembly cofactor RimP [Muribaculaceae bacterium]